MTISLEDKKNIEQIFSEVTIQQLDLSEKYFDILPERMALGLQLKMNIKCPLTSKAKLWFHN